MAAYIEPRVLKGFRDFLPSAEIIRRDMLETLEKSFRSYGFVPIDTPALEYTEILLGKGGGETEKQVYRFNDNGGRDVALRFDLTVPFARFLAEHRSELCIPFKRYHIAKVWRGENTQRGRYREFTQCDFDIIGSESAAADFEILHIMCKTLPVIACGNVKIHINHRGIFNRFLSHVEALDASVDILRTVDKLSKIGTDETLKLLLQFVGDSKAKVILDFVEIKGNFDETLAAMTEAAGQCPETERLSVIRQFMHETGIEDSIILDPSITRGLDYYTGVVFESFFTDLPDIGSICSGGRYDNLVGLYSPEHLPPLKGVGASIGIDRLIAGLEALGRLKPKTTYAKIAIACVSGKNSGSCQALAEKLRNVEIPCEVFLDEEKLSKQYMLAEKKGITQLIMPNDNDSAKLTLRDLTKRENHEFNSTDELIGFIKNSCI